MIDLNQKLSLYAFEDTNLSNIYVSYKLTNNLITFNSSATGKKVDMASDFSVSIKSYKNTFHYDFETGAKRYLDPDL